MYEQEKAEELKGNSIGYSIDVLYSYKQPKCQSGDVKKNERKDNVQCHGTNY
jgi:hypothetical protein